ncbi:hypothetical protein HZB90_00360 [archaeon]|nr:hypothetical protein [archaeon]
MLRSKKAITPAYNMMIAAVAAIVIIIILIILLKSIGDKTGEQSEKQRCKMSVTAYARLGSLPLGHDVKDERSIDCPTKFVTIKKATTRKMRTQIANLMVDCWDNYGEGKLTLFALGERYCALCSVFQFQDKSTQLKGLPGFMMTEPAPVVRKDWFPSYHEFITGEKPTESKINQAKGAADLNSLDGSKRYAVIFITGFKMELCAKDVIFGGNIMCLPKQYVNIASNLVVGEYSEQGLKDLGCTTLPVSMLDARFK